MRGVLKNLFKENREKVLSTNKTVMIVRRGSYIIGKIKSVDEVAVTNGIQISSKDPCCYHCFFTVTFEDETILRSYNISMFPYKIGEVNGIEFDLDSGHPSIGCRVDEVIF